MARRPTVLKTNIVAPFSLMLEQQITARKSVQLSVQRVNLNFFGTNKYLSIISEMKFYLSKKPASERRPYPAGFYISPYLKYRNVREVIEGPASSSPLSEVTYNMLGGGIMVGGQVIFRKGFTIDAFGGAGYYPLIHGRQTYGRDDGNGPYQAEITPQDYRWDLRLGICFGYAFK